MTGTLSKRQQARNEAVLQDLVHSTPGNDQCADCHARNPAWASWSLGVFLCMRCAAIHRKLGTHISKVKSLSMDAWTNEQVDNMRKVGNLASNKIYNPEGKKPPVPIDADEVDSAMERFIRQKYINNVGSQSGKSKKPHLDEGTPPPLPPKNSKFGFRSASSIFPLSSRSRKEAKHAAAHEAPAGSLSSMTNKQSKVFGATVDYGEDDTDKKLARLRDMGFQDDQRNAMILKGVNGSLERAVEALVRLGEGDRQSPAPAAASAERTLRTSRSLTPVGSDSASLGAGLTIPLRSATLDRPTTAFAPSTNPFDMIPPAPPQTAHSTGTLQNNNPYMHSTNPFGVPSQQTDFVNQAFQNLSLAPAQPLFPHHTGGIVSQQPHQFSRYQSPTSSTPSFIETYQSMGFQSNMTYPQPVPQSLMPQQTGYNPFLSQQASPFQQQTQQSISVNTAQAQSAYANNPFTRSPTRIASPPLSQIPEQSQSTVFQMPSPLQPQHTSTNPFLNSMMQYPVQTGQQPFGQQQFWQPKRQDKAAILALYSQPQAIRPLGVPSDSGLLGQAPLMSDDGISAAQTLQPAPMPVQSRSVSQPIPSSTNPFMKNGPVSVASDVFATDRKTSRESVNLGMDMAWTNGRHSPDAFASLSARHM
ncbi:UBA domain-containing protein 3 [Cladobotryum mycophilum]|uniref:UBA domain-containing protein 3 n=1 Tax=Cladobotryum mycophilum TaxID=491253 RepID=A0ABR0SKH6_9HYPO